MRFSTEEPEEHPEELLDLASAGQLGEADWKIVRAHLSHCEPCALQLAFATRAGQDTSSRQSDVALERRAIRRVEARLFADRRVDARPHPRRWLTLAFGILVLSGTAAAATWLSVRAIDQKRTQTRTRTPAPAEPRVGATAAVDGMRRLPSVKRAESASPAGAAASPGIAAAPGLLPDHPAARARGEDSSASVLFQRARDFRFAVYVRHRDGTQPARVWGHTRPFSGWGKCHIRSGK